MGGTVKKKARVYLSTAHIQAAAQFARACAQIEESYDGHYSEELFLQNRAFALGSLLTANSFVEATINEVFADIADERHERFKGLDPIALKSLAILWRTKHFPRHARTLEKYQVALRRTGKQQMATGQKLYQNVDSLGRLRNALVHYVPEWVTLHSSTGLHAREKHKLEKELSGKFAPNPIAKDKGHPFFPGQCLGHGCAEWAVNSTTRFVDEFCTRLGIQIPYDPIRSRLGTK